MPTNNYIPVADLPSFLGVENGDTLLIASDITRLAIMAIRHEGSFSPDRLINIFLEAIGPEGTLILPAFNFNLGNQDTFDAKHSIPITGALADTALNRDDFLRTWNPLHSFLVYGKYAGQLAGMHNRSSFGSDSPFAFFREHNVKMLMIGTNVTDAFTFVHHVEEMEQVRYRWFKQVRLKYIDEQGNESLKEFHLYAKKPGWTMNLSALEQLFRSQGILTEMTFNGIYCSVVRMGDAFPVIREDIQSNHARSISRFSPKLFLKEKLKMTLSSLHLYRTLTEKISHATGPR